MAEEIVGLKIKVDGSEVNKSIGQLRQEIVQTQQEVDKLSQKYGEQSQEAQAAQKKLTQLQDATNQKIEQQNKRIDDAAKTVSALSAAYGGVQGALELAGLAGEDTIKQLAKIQSALAIGDAVQNLAEFRDAISSTFGSFISSLKSSSAFQKINNTLTATSSTLMKAFGLSVDTTAISFRVLKGAIAATGIGLLVIAVGELVTAFQNYTTAAEKAKKSQEELNKTISDGAKAGLEAEIQFLDNQKQLDIARAKNKGATEKEIFDIEQRYRKLKANSQIRYWKEIKDVDKEGAKTAQREVDKINIEGTVAALDFQTKKNEKANAIKQAANEKEKERLKQEALDFAEAQEMIRRERELGAKITQTQILGVTAAGKDALITTQVVAQGVTNAIIVSSREQADAKTKLTEYEKKLEQEKFDAQLGLASQSLSIIGGLVDQNSAAGKAIAVTQAIINTYQGASKALAQGGIFGPVAAAATIAAGLINVKKIISTKIPSAKGGGSVADSGSPSMSMASAPIAPSAQIQNTVTSLSQQSINQMGSATGRAYVVESDITNSQEKIIRINRAARLG